LSDTFHLVRRHDPLERKEALEHLRQREVADHLTDHEKSAPHYKLDAGLETAINMALAVGAPLLVTGEPGTGKTQLAYFLADYFGIEIRSFLVKSTSTALDMWYDFDAVGYLQAAYAAQKTGLQADREDYLHEGALWQAFVDPEPSVLLIDEIDKAPRDFPNDLLHELDQGWFHHPFERGENGERVRVPEKKGQPPIVVITSNVERRLPGPFLRRCVFHHIELTPELIQNAVGERVREFPNLAPEVRNLAIERFWDLRRSDLQKPPSTAELLVWLAVLNALRIDKEELDKALGELPALGSLVKDHGDLDRLRKL